MKKQAEGIYRSVMAEAPEWEPLVDQAHNAPVRSGTHQDLIKTFGQYEH